VAAELADAMRAFSSAQAHSQAVADEAMPEAVKSEDLDDDLPPRGRMSGYVPDYDTGRDTDVSSDAGRRLADFGPARGGSHLKEFDQVGSDQLLHADLTSGPPRASQSRLGRLAELHSEGASDSGYAPDDDRRPGAESTSSPAQRRPHRHHHHHHHHHQRHDNAPAANLARQPSTETAYLGDDDEPSSRLRQDHHSVPSHDDDDDDDDDDDGPPLVPLESDQGGVATLDVDNDGLAEEAFPSPGGWVAEIGSEGRATPSPTARIALKGLQESTALGLPQLRQRATSRLSRSGFDATPLALPLARARFTMGLQMCAGLASTGVISQEQATSLRWDILNEDSKVWSVLEALEFDGDVDAAAQVLVLLATAE
jgi:hypothetical protein